MSNEATVTILVDNHARAGLTAEHGLAMWINVGGRKLLFDTGAGGALPVNARQLGIHLNKTDMVVLSHGHFDHTGGLPWVLRQAHRANVYCHPGIVLPRFGMTTGKARSIAIPSAAVRSINRIPAGRLHWVREPLQLTPDVGLTGPPQRSTTYEDTGGPFFLDSTGTRPDPVDDDLALTIKMEGGVVVCVGCCHSGLVNTLNHVRHLTNNAPVQAVIGGFHLVTADSRRLEATAEALDSLGVPTIVACHCTGTAAVAYLQKRLGGRLIAGEAGMNFRFL